MLYGGKRGSIPIEINAKDVEFAIHNADQALPAWRKALVSTGHGHGPELAPMIALMTPARAIARLERLSSRAP